MCNDDHAPPAQTGCGAAAAADGCCAAPPAAAPGGDPRYRRVLWIALVLNVAMFGVEIVAGLRSGSVSLLADAVDFFGDAGNYALSLWALAAAPVWGPRVAAFKGACMLGFGVFVLARAAWSVWAGVVPEPLTMSLIGALALGVNVSVAWMLYAFREGDANMRSVWLCSRNDALGNLAVVAAAAGVWGSGTAWPDLAVAGVMAALALSAGTAVLRHARAELRALAASAAAADAAAPLTAPTARGSH